MSERDPSLPDFVADALLDIETYKAMGGHKPRGYEKAIEWLYEEVKRLRTQLESK